MKLDAMQLRDLLNYDTHTTQFLTFIERIELHKAISRSMNGWGFSFSGPLAVKIKRTLTAMKNQNWDTTRGAYVFDKDAGINKFQIIK